jgi:hypothetical protein
MVFLIRWDLEWGKLLADSGSLYVGAEPMKGILIWGQMESRVVIVDAKPLLK